MQCFSHENSVENRKYVFTLLLMKVGDRFCPQTTLARANGSTTEVNFQLSSLVDYNFYIILFLNPVVPNCFSLSCWTLVLLLFAIFLLVLRGT